MRILFLGDIHLGTRGAEDLPQDVDLLIITGDFTLKGRTKEAKAVLEHFKRPGLKTLALAGNMDYPEIDLFLAKEGLGLHGEGIVLKGRVGIFGAGASAPTPFNTPNELGEEEIYTLLEKGYAQVKDTEEKVMVCHTPPLDTNCDKLPNGMHVGSAKVRQFIEKYQPDYCLCGHIHEGVGIDKIGSTTVVNPGAFLEGHYGILDTGQKSVELKRILN